MNTKKFHTFYHKQGGIEIKLEGLTDATRIKDIIEGSKDYRGHIRINLPNGSFTTDRRMHPK